VVVIYERKKLNDKKKQIKTSGVSPSGDDTRRAGSNAERRQTDRLNEVVERQFGDQLKYSDVEVVCGWSE